MRPTLDRDAVADAHAGLLGHHPDRVGAADQDRVFEPGRRGHRTSQAAADSRAADTAQRAIAARLPGARCDAECAADDRSCGIRALVLDVDLAHVRDAAVGHRGLCIDLARHEDRAQQRDRPDYIPTHVHCSLLQSFRLIERRATGIGVNAFGAPYPPGCRLDDASRRRVNAALHNASRALYDSSDHGFRGQKNRCAPMPGIDPNPVRTVTRTQS